MTYVYVAINPATNPPCIKIGITDDIDKRMKQLSVGQLRRWESSHTTTRNLKPRACVTGISVTVALLIASTIH